MSTTETRSSNRLAEEKSPYLLQHARNPVDWHPWGEEAFELARSTNRPLFVSIGYSTCHWCHVMERESFEDDEVAGLMNEAFVNVKVDREERPDVDHLYMTACQVASGRGGWPLTVLLTPDLRPFFTATYIPRESRFGAVGMLDFVPRIADIWRTRRGEVEQSSVKVLKAMQSMEETESGELGPEVLIRAGESLEASFDAENGGFSNAPKFPSPHVCLFLLRLWRRTGENRWRDMAATTLRAMCRGGIFDHLGYGFHRYSTDETWLTPHFEKMLYDQAMMVLALSEAFQATGESVFRGTALAVCEYVRRDLTGAEGAFLSAEDADSEGEEGRFYVWSAAELRDVLGADAELFMRAHGATEEGNFHDEATGEPTGKNILHLPRPLEELAREEGLDSGGVRDRLEEMRARLEKVREKRVRPHKDDKVLTDWNGLMIGALSRASDLLGAPELARDAKRAADFLLATMRRDGRLLHRWRDGEAAVPGMLGDYANLAWGVGELSRIVSEPEYLKAARELTDAMLEEFDDGGGGLYLAPQDTELPLRQRDLYDGAMPSANSIALLVLLSLAERTGESHYDDRARKLLKSSAGQVLRHPAGFAMLLCGLDAALPGL